MNTSEISSTDLGGGKEDETGAEAGKTVFVTVGTTSFDALVRATTTVEFRELLTGQGYSKLTVQIGHGKYVPEATPTTGVSISWYRFKDSLAQDMKAASLIISHGGSGSIMESLCMGKPLLVVINNQLMGNHQTELAEELTTLGHLLHTTPQDLCDVMKKLAGRKWVKYEPGQPHRLAQDLDAIMGFR